MASDYVLSEGSYKKLLAWLERERLFCFRCGGEILPGDEVHRCGKVFARNSEWDFEPKGNPLCRFYHSECFERLFFGSEVGGKE